MRVMAAMARVALALATLCIAGTSAESAGHNSLPSRLRYLSFYGFNPGVASVENWASVGSSVSLRLINESYDQIGLPYMFEAFTVFFLPMSAVNASLQGMTLNPNWTANWAAVVPELRALAEKGALTGIFVGDELVWNNITWDQLDAVATLVKSTFPDLFVWYNEGFGPLAEGININNYRVHYPHVPVAFDFWSMDDYRSPERAQQVYELYLYPRMNQTYQKVMLIPPVYGNPQLPTCNVSCLDAAVLNSSQRYWNWALSDPLVVGFDGFHLPTYAPTDVGLESLPQSLAFFQGIGAQLRASQRLLDTTG